MRFLRGKTRDRVGLICRDMANCTKECRILSPKSVDIFKTRVILKEKDVYDLNYYGAIHKKGGTRETVCSAAQIVLSSNFESGYQSYEIRFYNNFGSAP